MDWNAFFAVFTLAVAILSAIGAFSTFLWALLDEYSSDKTVRTYWIVSLTCAAVFILSLSTVFGMGWSY